MALFHSGDVVAVRIDASGLQWAYGRLISCGYTLNCWEVQFADGSTMWSDSDLFREDERDMFDEPDDDEYGFGPDAQRPGGLIGELTVTFTAADRDDAETRLAGAWPSGDPGTCYDLRDAQPAEGRFRVSVHALLLDAARAHPIDPADGQTQITAIGQALKDALEDATVSVGAVRRDEQMPAAFTPAPPR